LNKSLSGIRIGIFKVLQMEHGYSDKAQEVSILRCPKTANLQHGCCSDKRGDNTQTSATARQSASKVLCMAHQIKTDSLINQRACRIWWPRTDSS
jgi:hypothetical protein